MEALKLGQLGERTDEGVWLFIVPNGTAYLTWGEGEDEDYREMLGIEPDASLPRIQVRRLLNPAHAAYQRKAFRRYSRIGELPPELEQKIQREAVAHTVLVGWENIEVPGKGVLPYTPELGVEALKADPMFSDAVVAAAADEQRFREQAIAQDGELLGKSSSGSSNGETT